ncbi:MAG: carbohydrate-binding family 9-like protein [Pyrinomonadaceae bacterium]|nr:carbohydrate-binding family 9-like protein [Pyrinomonadaceae bacterium]
MGKQQRKAKVEAMQASVDTIEAYYINEEFSLTDLDHGAWNDARPVQITRYWSGKEAPTTRHLEARVIWSGEALSVSFICRQAEPLIVSLHPQCAQKTMNLWERDVCEVFIAPEACTPERYREFEAAPTGEWLDLAIHQTPLERATDRQFSSGMTTAARIASGEVRIATRIPWQAFGRAPRAGDGWRANLFRCVGSGAERGYLAWQPTLTIEPNFHVPQVFGWLRFNP